MKKTSVSVFVFVLICFHAFSQLTFQRVDTVKVIEQGDTLVNPWAGGLNFPVLCEMDLNGDGIMDIVFYEPGDLPGHDRIMPFINNGTHGKVDYHYAPQYISHFPHLNGFIASYDYNHDGKMDLFTLSDTPFYAGSAIRAYRNDFNSIDSLNFNVAADPILTRYPSYKTNVFASYVSVPSFIDINNDGAMDIISWPSNLNGQLEYQKNIAIDSGLPLDSLRFINASQCWGDFSIQVGTPYNRVNTFGLNCGPIALESPNWDRGTASSDDTNSVILVYDNEGINGNGAKDAIIGGGADDNALYIHNGGTPGKDSMDYQDYNFPSYNVPVNLSTFPYFFYLDVNNDSSKDLIVTCHTIDNYRGVLFYKNLDPPADSTKFAFQPHGFMQQDMIDVGAGAAPYLFDYNADGLPDLLIGDESYHDTSGVDHKGITLYQNVGTASNPEFQFVTHDYAGIDALVGVGGTICPTFGDLNGDGAPDMIVGMGDGITETMGNGELLYFENTASAGNPANFVLVSSFFDSIAVGGNSAPQLYDLNHDGLLDLVVGNSFGLIKYYQNHGDTTHPLFYSKPTKDTLGGIIAQPAGGYTTGYASPFFYNDNGTDKLILGTEYGKVYVYDGINGNILGNYHLTDSLINGEEGQNLIPFIGDINHDGHPDMLIGNYNGGVGLYMNKDTSNLYLGLNELQAPIRASFDAYPNPASDELHLNFYHIEGTHPVCEIINNIGQVIYKSDVTGSTMTVSLNNFSNGIYAVRFICDSNTQSQKIIVQKH